MICHRFLARSRSRLVDGARDRYRRFNSQAEICESTCSHRIAGGFCPPRKPLDFLVVAPHPDDAELGMGGTIAKMIDQGWRVGVLDLTTGEPTPRGSEPKRRAETIAATEILNITWRGNAGLPNRKLESTLAARERVASYIRVLRPPLDLCSLLARRSPRSRCGH